MNTEQTKKDVSSKTSSKLREMLKDIDLSNAEFALERGALSARARIERLLDPGTFVEIGKYVKCRSEEFSFSGVICGYGALDGRLVFVFSQDYDRNNSAIDEFYTQKILSLYDAALKNGAPIVAIFDGDVNSSSKDAATYLSIGRITKAVSDASGIIPQIAIVVGNLNSDMIPLVSMFDFVINSSSDNYLLSKNAAFNEENEYKAIEKAAILLNRLPQNNAEGTLNIENNANINRMIDKNDFTNEIDIKKLINRLSDDNDFLEIGTNVSLDMITGFVFIGGISVGICANRSANNEKIISADAARKAARFIRFCDSFNIPLITLVDAAEVEKSAEASTELANLSFSYAVSTNAKITVILGEVQNLSFVIMGSKSLGADVVLATDGQAERNELAQSAAMIGEIDDIIEFGEIRKRICSALEMLSSKSTLPFSKKNPNYTVRGW